MNTEEDARIRNGLTLAAVVDPPNDLADGALHRMHRQRRRRLAELASVASVAAVVTLLAVLVPAVRPHQRPANTAAGTQDPYVVSSYCTPEPDEKQPRECRVLDPRSGQYERVDEKLWGSMRIGSPDGSRYLVQRLTKVGRETTLGGDQAVYKVDYAVVGRDDLIDGNIAAAHWVGFDRNGGPLGWSPDGRTILFEHFTTRFPNPAPEHLTGFSLLDVATGRFQPRVPLREGPSTSLALFWDPSGQWLWNAVPQPDKKNYRMIRIDLHGRALDPAVELPPTLPDGAYPYQAEPASPARYFSPDGRYLVCGYHPAKVCDLRTGELHEAGGGPAPSPLVDANGRPRRDPEHDSDYRPIWWYDREHLLIHRSEGTKSDLAVVDVRGKVVREIAFPSSARVETSSIEVSAASGYPPGIGWRI